MIPATDEIKPAAIESPGDHAELARMLRKYSDEHCAIIPRGGGTSDQLGAPSKSTEIVLSLEKLNRILDYQPENLTVRVEAGVTLDALNRTLAEHGQFVPLDPPLPARATVGGILAANASGALRVRYGTARDLVIGMRVALTDGNIVKGGGQTVKNVAGYDLPKLFIGSLGTLGVIVEATFKVSPLPKKTATAVGQVANLSPACALAIRLLQSKLLPIGLLVLNRAASEQLGLGSGYTSLVRFGGNESGVSRQFGDVESWSRDADAGASVKAMDDDAALWARVRDFIFEHMMVVKISVLPTQVAAIAQRVEEIAEKYRAECLIAAQALGIVDVALISGDAASAIEEMRGAAIAVGGHLTIERAPRALRERVDAWGPSTSLRTSLGMMQKLKREFDPNGVLNPGWFVGKI